MKFRNAEKEMLPNSVASIIRQAILKKEINPGEKLVQADLAEQLGVSRMPVREALKTLEKEGLVIIEPHKGAVVAELTTEDIDEIFGIRAVIEPMVLAKSIPNLDTGDLSHIKALHARMLKTEVKEEYVELNREFHTLLCSKCTSKRLHGLMEQVSHGLAKDTPYIIPSQIQKSNIEHEAIINAIEAMDIAAAGNALGAHIDRTRTDLIETLNNGYKI